MAKISVIVPVYNVENYLNECIDSILNQTFTDSDLILVDDGSTDKSPVICDCYEKTYSNIIVIHQKNMGQSGARNTGIEWAIKNSQSEYICFVDSDDTVSKKEFLS